jgi:hypothetical protein
MAVGGKQEIGSYAKISQVTTEEGNVSPPSFEV